MQPLRTTPSRGASRSGRGVTTLDANQPPAAQRKAFIWARATSDDSFGSPTSPVPARPQYSRQGDRVPWNAAVPQPPPTAARAERPVARSRPLAQALDLFDAQRLATPSTGTRPSNSRAAQRQEFAKSVGLTPNDEFDLGPMPPRARSETNIPIIVDDTWHLPGIEAHLPQLEKTVALVSGRRNRRKP